MKSHIKRTFFSISLLFLLFSQVNAEGLKEKLTSLPQLSGIEELSSEIFTEKYLVLITQPLDHHNPGKGSFTQRVIISHKGFDRPTVIVTEGYGGAYALRETYQEELSRLFDTNIVFVEHRYFQESTPEPINWDYLTAENSAYDLHHVRETFNDIYTDKWISTGISKGGQTATLYRAYFPDDVDISVPYVAPLNRAIEDERHVSFLKKNTGTKKERKKIRSFQLEVLQRKSTMTSLLKSFSEEKKLTYRIPLEEVLDYCVLEYPFALWQWGTTVSTIPALNSDDQTIFDHLMSISSSDYFSKQQSVGSFFVQASKELGYYPYETASFHKYLTIANADGYVKQLMLPEGTPDYEYSDALYHKIYHFLRDNDPKMIFIYGEFDPWSATRVPDFKGKKNLQIYIEPKGSHRARINTMPAATQEKIINQLKEWLAE